MSTLAEQVVEQLKTDMDNVYDAGYQKGKSEGGIDLFQYATSLDGTFTNADFSDNPNVVINIPNFEGNTISALFNSVTNLESVKLVCNVRNVEMHASTAFYSCRTIKLIDFSEFNVTFGTNSSLFGSCTLLERILGELDFSRSQTFPNTFGQCTSLIEVRFTENCIKANISFSSSSKLSDESIQSIIDGLADLTGQTTQTLTLHADVKAKLTEEQIATITSKNWTLA